MILSPAHSPRCRSSHVPKRYRCMQYLPRGRLLRWRACGGTWVPRAVPSWYGEEEGGGGTEISRRLALGILRLVILQFPSKLLFLYFSPDLSGLVRHSRHLDLLNRGHPPLVLQHSVLHESELWIEVFACIALNPLRFLYGLT